MSFYNDALQQNNTEIQSNNVDLQGLLDTINALPVAKPEQTKTATPSLSQQTISPDSGKVLSGVTVEPITSTLLTSLDSDFKAENIAEGVNMFGLVGTMAEASVEFGWFEISERLDDSYPYQEVFIIGMTWAEWLNTALNAERYGDVGYGKLYADGNGVSGKAASGITGKVSVDGTETGVVDLTDVITNQSTYYIYISAVPGFPT